MKTISFNSAVAKLCGNNGIVKAVLLNYIYNYHKYNVRKRAGHPVQITLAEFVYQYCCEDDSLWHRSFVHKILRDLEKDGHLKIDRENNLPVYSVSDSVTSLLNQQGAKIVSFDLEMACNFGIHVAIMSRHLLYVIGKSPGGVAYNLDVDEMSEVNRISPAQIYRAIKYLIENQVLKRAKSHFKFQSRALSLAKCRDTMQKH